VLELQSFSSRSPWYPRLLLLSATAVNSHANSQHLFPIDDNFIRFRSFIIRHYLYTYLFADYEHVSILVLSTESIRQKESALMSQHADQLASRPDEQFLSAAATSGATKT